MIIKSMMNAGSTPAASTRNYSSFSGKYRPCTVPGWIFLLFILASPATASDPWSRQDKVLEGVYLVLHFVDMAQTIDISSREREGYYECNPVLGKHPSRAAVYSYFLATAAAHVGLTHFLPSKCRPWFQSVGIGIEAFCVVKNYSIGLRLRF